MGYFLTIAGIIIAGAVVVVKAEAIYRFMGPVDWAETHLSTEGGTRLLIKLVGLAFILGTFLWITGALQAMLLAIFSPIAGVFS